MIERFEPWQDRFNELSLRERLLLIAAIVALSYIGFEMVLMESVYDKQNRMVEEIGDWESRNRNIEKHIATLTEKLNGIKSNKSDSQVNMLKVKVGKVGKQLENMMVQFIRPNQMVAVLKNLLDNEPGLRLMKFKNLRAQPLLNGENAGGIDEFNTTNKQVVELLQFYRDRELVGVQSDYDKFRADLNMRQKKENMDEAGIPQVYKHGILIELQGSYQSTVKYLKSVEKLPWKFYWDAVRYEVIKYPKAKVTILINTLSLERGWVSV